MCTRSLPQAPMCSSVPGTDTQSEANKAQRGSLCGAAFERGQQFASLLAFCSCGHEFDFGDFCGPVDYTCIVACFSPRLVCVAILGLIALCIRRLIHALAALSVPVDVTHTCIVVLSAYPSLVPSSSCSLGRQLCITWVCCADSPDSATPPQIPKPAPQPPPGADTVAHASYLSLIHI